MTTHLEIETLSNDNNKSLFRSQRIKLNGKEVITPLKSIDHAKIRSSISLNDTAFGCNEIYRQLNSARISAYQEDQYKHDQFSRAMSNLIKNSSNDLNICLIKFSPNNDNMFPSQAETEFLTDVAHSFSDIVSMPIVDIKIDRNNFSEYLNYLQLYYKTIEELNNKPIMGMLPNLPREFYPKLLEFYLERQIHSFCFDFAGRTPDHLKLRPVMRHLNTRQILGETLIYGVNTRPGRALKNATVVPSKDFIAFGFGLDVLGENHAGLKLPKEFFEKMKRAVANKQENKKRIFIKSNYGYYKTGDENKILDLYPDDTKVKLDDILHDPRRLWEKCFNMEQQSIETAVIKKRLNSLDRNETILTYIKEKSHIKKEFKHLESGPKNIAQQVLRFDS